MKYAGLLGFFLLIALPPALADPQLGQVNVRFFSENISIPYAKNMLLTVPATPREPDMVAFYQAMERTDYQVLLRVLEEKKAELQLNDWLYFDLMKRSLLAIIGTDRPAGIELTTWFLLSKAGFDTRLTYLKNQQFVYVYTQDEIFEVPMITENGRNYANLTSIPQHRNANQALYMLNFVANRDGRPFRFYLDELPRLKSDIERKHFNFVYKGRKYEMELDVDRTTADVMSAYPFIDEQQYLKIPLSKTISRELIPLFQRWTDSLTTIETLELLAAFTRSSFQYKEDKDYFGRSKPMIADEVFHYPYSDCEDRSALYFCLVRELIDLPMIIVAFPDHLTIAVALDKTIGPAIRFDGRDYYICDPTGPINSAEIGAFPYGYEKSKFRIIGRHK